MDATHHEVPEQDSPLNTTSEPASLRWTHILAISIFALALNFQWAAMGTIILPSQVFKMVGDLDKGSALAFVLIPGAFVSLFANPLFGWLSDRTQGRLATWGRRRPYILLGTLASVATLLWMASARSILSLAVAYALTQFASNAAQSPFHALLPDIVPPSQRGLTSGVIGLLVVVGNIGGIIAAGALVNSALPVAVYQQRLWLVYGIIIAVLIIFMLITLFVVRERSFARIHNSGPLAEQHAASSATPRRHWWSYPAVRTLAFWLFVALLAWMLVGLWNRVHVAGIVISGDVEQVIIELIVTIGILRLFDFHPRRDPDFAWVLVTRMIMMLGIYTIQSFLQYYMRDVVKVANPEQETTFFLIVVAIASLFSSLTAGWLSDRFGRKRLVYVSGGLMAVVGGVFVITHSLPLVLAAGAIFGLGYGAYQSVDWALVADTLPSAKNYARDMGVWNVALSLSQVVAPVIGGPLLDTFAHAGHQVLGYQILFAMAIAYCVIGTITVRFIRNVPA